MPVATPAPVPVSARLPPWLENDRRGAGRTLLRGQALWRSGDAAVQFTWIEAGLAKIVHIGSEGTETIFGLFGPGDCIGDAAVLEQGAYPADAIAASARLTVRQKPAAPILAAAAVDPALAAALREPLLRHTRVLRQTIETFSAGTVPRRLATLLLILGERFGTQRGASGRLVLPLHLSRAELAALVGARIETTIRILSRWQREGRVVTLPGSFVLRLDSLRAIAQI